MISQIGYPKVPDVLPAYLTGIPLSTIPDEWCINCENETLIVGDFKGQRECTTCGCYIASQESCVLGEEDPTLEYEAEMAAVYK